MSSKKNKPRGRGKKIYSVGQINKMIDCIFHPLYDENEWIRLADFALHAAVEQNLSKSIEKFAKYNVPELAKKLLRKL